MSTAEVGALTHRRVLRIALPIVLSKWFAAMAAMIARLSAPDHEQHALLTVGPMGEAGLTMRAKTRKRMLKTLQHPPR